MLRSSVSSSTKSGTTSEKRSVAAFERRIVGAPAGRGLKSTDRGSHQRPTHSNSASFRVRVVEQAGQHRVDGHLYQLPRAGAALERPTTSLVIQPP